MTGPYLPSFPVKGGCVCGAVRYGVQAAPLSVYACHCKDCQRFSGGPFSVAMTVRPIDFSLEQGHPARLAKPADSGRVVGVRFCRDCGTRLWHEPAHSPRLVNIAAGPWTTLAGRSLPLRSGHREKLLGSASQIQSTFRAMDSRSTGIRSTMLGEKRQPTQCELFGKLCWAYGQTIRSSDPQLLVDG